jgi:hypothetical protein
VATRDGVRLDHLRDRIIDPKSTLPTGALGVYSDWQIDYGTHRTCFKP